MAKMSKFQIWIVAIGMIGIILTGAGLLIRNQLLDPGNGDSDVYIPTNGNGYTPSYEPEISRSSIKVFDLDSSHFRLGTYVKNWWTGTTLDVSFYVNTINVLEDSMGTPTDGYYLKNFYRTQFSGIADDDIILIYLVLKFEGKIIDAPWDPIDGFSFGELPPIYNEPEIIEDSRVQAPNLETERVVFSFLVSDFELVNSISYYFVVDDEIIEGIGGLMTQKENGLFETSFSYTLFDLTKENWVYLIMNFENEDGDNEDKNYDEFLPFQYGEPTPTPTPTPTNGTPPTNGAGINYIFAIIATIVAFTLFITIKKIKARKEMND